MSRRVMALWIGCLAALALPAALLLLLFTALHDRAIDTIYKNLDDISDKEMPATVTSFQSGPDITVLMRPVT